MNIEKHTPIDGEYYLITDIDGLFAKAYHEADAKLIAQSKRMLSVLKRMHKNSMMTANDEMEIKRIILSIE